MDIHTDTIRGDINTSSPYIYMKNSKGNQITAIASTENMERTAKATSHNPTQATDKAYTYVYHMYIHIYGQCGYL